MKFIPLAVGSALVALVTASPSHAQCDDVYEPDNSAFGTAAMIADGETQHRSFCDSSSDWVGFVACGGQSYTIETANLGDQADTYLEIYSPEQAVVAFDDDGNGGLASRINWVAPVSGLYHVRIHQADNVYGVDREYDLHLKGPTTSCDLWTYSGGFGGWDESTALIQRQDGKLLATGRTESFSGFPSPSPWLPILRMDGSTESIVVPDWRGVSHAAVRDAAGNIVIVGESNQLSGGADWSSYLLAYGKDGLSPRVAIIGTTSDDYSNAIAILPDGSYAVAGSTLGGAGGGLDGWLYRAYVDESSTTVGWQRSIGRDGSEELYAVLANANGDITVAGYTTSSGAGQKDGLVARLSSSGSLLWSRAIGGAGGEEFRKAFETPDGGLLLVGTTTGTSLVVAANLWFVKLDNQGQVQWEKTLGAGGDDRILNALDVGDGYVLAGYSDSTAVGNSDGLLVKVDLNGDPVWVRTFGAAGTDRLYDVIRALDGSLIAAGYTKSFGAGLADALIVKTTLAGDTGPSCATAVAPAFTAQPRTSAVSDPLLGAVSVSGTTTDVGSIDVTYFSSPSVLQCHLLAPTEVSGPDAIAPLTFTSRTNLTWEPQSENHSDSFNVYRGDIAGLPNGDSGSCLGTIPTNAYTELDNPAYLEGWFYLVTGRNSLGEGSLGKDSAGFDRPNVSPCP